MKAAFKVCLLFVLLALVGPGNALALTSQQAVEKIRAAFDEKTIRQGLDEVRYSKKAGFIYQPALSVPRSGTCPIEEIWDQKAVMSGMVACDRTNAFFYGTYKDLRQETEILRKLMPQVAPLGVTRKSGRRCRRKWIRRKGAPCWPDASDMCSMNCSTTQAGARRICVSSARIFTVTR